MSTTELDLRRRFAVRTERFSHGGLDVEILLPRSADELIDASDANQDERLPYWADLWPSARALSALLLDAPPPGGRVLELGCGIALPSLALRWRGVEVVATDYYADALRFARVNAERNGITPPETRLMDWRDPDPTLGRFGLVLAADVLYERRNVEALSGLLPRVLAPGGRVLIADPGRMYTGEFETRMAEEGWRVEEIARRDEPAPGTEGVRIVIRILQFLPPRSGDQRPKL